MSKRSETRNAKLRSGREQGMACAAYGAALQLDRQGAHRPKRIENKKHAAERKACRGRSW